MNIDNIMEQIRENQLMKIKRCKRRLKQINKCLHNKDVLINYKLFDELEPKTNRKNCYYEYLTTEEQENNNFISKDI